VTVIDQTITALRSRRFTCADEAELQSAVAAALSSAGLGYTREARLSARDRVDFMIDGGIALELKVRTDGKELLRQVLRYAEHDAVKAILIAGTTHKLLLLPETANGKPLRAIQLQAW
jgi:hypothetical protein